MRDYKEIQVARSGDGGSGELSIWEQEFLKEYSLDIKSPILDIGCGNGGLIRSFSAMGLSAMGLEISDEAVKKGITMGTPIVNWDAHNEFPFPEKTFKNITMFHVIEHTYDPQKVVDNIYRVLDGTIYMIAPGSDNNKQYAHYLTYKTFDELKSYFSRFQILRAEVWNNYFLIVANNERTQTIS